MELKTFYYCETTGKEIPANNPVFLNKAHAVEIALQVLRESEGFIGFVDRNNTTLQFCGDDSGNVWMEIPVPEKQGSYGKYIELTQIPSAIQSLSETFDYELIPGLEFRKW